MGGREEAVNKGGEQGVNTCPTSLNMLSGKREAHFTRHSSERKPDKPDVYTDSCRAYFRSHTSNLHAAEMLSLSSCHAVNTF